ncbi:hypothetical protein BDM02DRAFT_3183463 [Thelephora ganbajun]|uniref:Uncharacterized protein n=1 Tax=Thelephora ganbajun TaxID=370292 RepID=A0ACB6ZT07_THEGA|nr:hypothetical protein BDM02DRAFT_3183463 [Thelephora ganbajun]
MANYERSTQSPYRTYKPSRERTSDWVSRLPPKHAAQFVDPTMPPSDTESAVYSSDSDAESTHSFPPRFVLRFPDGREERVSEGYYSNANASMRNGRSRATSGPVDDYGPPPSHHHSRSLSLHPSTGHSQVHSRVSGPLFRPHSSNANPRPQEEIRVLPPQRSVTPGTTGYANSRSTQSHLPRASSLLVPTPRRAYDRDQSDAPHHGPPDNWVMKHGPPQAIVYSNSHPPSKYDMPTRDYSANGYRPHSSSRLSQHPIMGSPVSQMTQLTKENTIANSHSRTLSRGIVEDSWTLIDEDEEWEKEQQRAAYRRGRTSSQSSHSPTLTHSRSRTNSSSSRSNYYAPGPNLSAPEKLGPPPAHSTGAGSMKRPFFTRLFRAGSDKSLPIAPSPPSNRLHRRHSMGGSKR